MENSLKNTLRNTIRDTLLACTDYKIFTAQALADRLTGHVMTVIKDWDIAQPKEVESINIHIGTLHSDGILKPLQDIFNAHLKHAVENTFKSVNAGAPEARKNGYHWVKFTKNSDWTIAFFDADKNLFYYMRIEDNSARMFKTEMVYAVQVDRLTMAEPLKEEKPKRKDGRYPVVIAATDKITTATYISASDRWIVMYQPGEVKDDSFSKIGDTPITILS